MEYVSLIFSALAFGLSSFTFYWVHLRVNHALHLVRINNNGEFNSPRFAIVNSGSKDILVTSISGWFVQSDQARFSPAQRVEIGEGPSMLIKAGTATQCKINFPASSFTNSFVTSGKLLDGLTESIYEFEFTIDVDWVDCQACSHKVSVPFAKYGFEESGRIRSFSPLDTKHNLYKS
ncbi:hypothetical protein MHN79_03195 [Vibrio sp. Of14-4]|uniref:hypothetical protein n=1 Tax=Vibrio sp. Of14-4 TaxID=2724878 RepID=UPI001EF2EBCB|nr:hypothetical protein [Vibrio sp. Of14-4]MCG7488487.1 hypothetical protein [Vibrio sp. Of14-4]